MQILLIIEVFAPTKELRDAALKRAEALAQERQIQFLSIGKSDNGEEHFFSYIEPDEAGPAADILGHNVFPNRNNLRILAKISHETTLLVKDR